MGYLRCDPCQGTGIDKGSDLACKSCGGYGKVYVPTISSNDRSPAGITETPFSWPFGAIGAIGGVVVTAQQWMAGQFESVLHGVLTMAGTATFLAAVVGKFYRLFFWLFVTFMALALIGRWIG